MHIAMSTVKIKAINDRSITPAVLLEGIAMREPTELLAISTTRDGAISVDWSSMSLERVCLLERLLGIEVERKLREAASAK